MKKALLILMSVLLMAGFMVGCGANNDPQEDAHAEAYALYLAMNEAIADITSMEARADMQISIEAEGEIMDMSIVMEMKTVYHSETEIEMAMYMNMDMGLLGGQTEMAMYFRDGWLYMDGMGMQIRSPMPLEDLGNYMDTDLFNALEFTKEAIIDASVEAVGNNKRLNFTLRGDALQEVMDTMMGEMMDALLLGAEMDIKYSDMIVSILLDANNMPLEQRMIFSLEMDIEGDVGIINYDINMTDISYNTLTAIEFPANLGGFMEWQL